MATLYVGYDLGDGETLVSFAEYVNDNTGRNYVDKIRVRMPGSVSEGIAIPTAYAVTSNGEIKIGKGLAGAFGVEKVYSNFKKRPSELLDKLDQETLMQFKTSSDWPESVSTSALETMKNHIVTFTDALFTDEKIQEAFATAANDKDSIIFAVGYPTKWNADKNNRDFDKSIYKKIFEQTIIGKKYFEINTHKKLPSELIFDTESRAAFLNAKEEYFDENKTENYYFDKSRLIIDVGSSTVDISAYPKDNKKKLEPFHDGEPYLGARIIDYYLTEYFIEEMKKGNNSELFFDLLEKNEDLFMQLVLSARQAKEICYSEGNPTLISFLAEFTARIDTKLLESIENKEIGYILKKYLNVSDETVAAYEHKTWKEQFRTFLEKNKELLLNDYEVEEIVLTGSASKMPFIKNICKEVFNFTDKEFLGDNDRGACIADGLARMGASQEKSRKFREKCEQFKTEIVPQIVRNHYSLFAEKNCEIIYNIIVGKIIIPTCEDWSKKTNNSSLNDLFDVIKEKTSGDYLQNILNNDEQYSKELFDLSNKINDDLNINLKALFRGNADYQEKATDNNINNFDSISFTNNTFDINLSNVIASISSGLTTCVSWIGVVVVGFCASTFGLSVPIPVVASGGFMLSKQIKKMSDAVYASVKEFSSKREKKMNQNAIGKKIYFEKLISNLKKNKAENIKKIQNDIMKEEKSIIDSINNQLEKEIIDAQNKIAYLIEDNDIKEKMD